MNVDPLADMYPSHSPYNYVANNPVMLIDPNGMCIGWGCVVEAWNHLDKAYKHTLDAWNKVELAADNLASAEENLLAIKPVDIETWKHGEQAVKDAQQAYDDSRSAYGSVLKGYNELKEAYRDGESAYHQGKIVVEVWAGNFAGAAESFLSEAQKKIEDFIEGKEETGDIGLTQISGTSRPDPEAGEPNSIFTHLVGDGSTAKTNYIFDGNGKLIFEVNFMNHGGGSVSGHGHKMQIPGDIESGHTLKGHVSPIDVPKQYLRLPAGVKPKIPIGN